MTIIAVMECPRCGSEDVMDTGCGLTCNTCGFTEIVDCEEEE